MKAIFSTLFLGVLRFLVSSVCCVVFRCVYAVVCDLVRWVQGWLVD
jgi:hypothetical protein